MVQQLTEIDLRTQDQTIVFELENDSGATNRFGFLFRLFDTVIR